MDADDEMAKQAEEMMKKKGGMKKAPLIKRDKTNFDSGDYFKKKEENEKNP